MDPTGDRRNRCAAAPGRRAGRVRRARSGVVAGRERGRRGGGVRGGVGVAATREGRPFGSAFGGPPRGPGRRVGRRPVARPTRTQRRQQRQGRGAVAVLPGRRRSQRRWRVARRTHVATVPRRRSHTGRSWSHRDGRSESRHPSQRIRCDRSRGWRRTRRDRRSHGATVRRSQTVWCDRRSQSHSRRRWCDRRQPSRWAIPVVATRRQPPQSQHPQPARRRQHAAQGHHPGQTYHVDRRQGAPRLRERLPRRARHLSEETRANASRQRGPERAGRRPAGTDPAARHQTITASPHPTSHQFGPRIDQNRRSARTKHHRKRR